MKTITEFSGALLREAAKVWRARKPTDQPPSPGAPEPEPEREPGGPEAVPPPEAASAPEPEPEREPGAAEAVPPPQAASAPEPEPEREPGAAEAVPPPQAASAPAPPEPSEPGDAGEAAAAAPPEGAPPAGVPPEVLEAIGAATGLAGDRLARLVDALEVAGDKVAEARRVVVYGAEDPPPKAKKRGELFYLVDFPPRPEKAHGRRGRDDRDRGGGPGGRGDRPPRRGGRGPGGMGDDRRGLEREPPRSEVPAAGAGWRLQRAPAEPGDRRERGRGGPRRDRGGPRHDRGGPGGGPPPKKPGDRPSGPRQRRPEAKPKP